MQVRAKHESDGICFGRQLYRCQVMSVEGIPKGCNTYKCIHYKPCGCEDWIRIDYPDRIEMYEPEELKFIGVTEWQSIQETRVQDTNAR